MAYTDLQLKDATQIAYLSFVPKYFKAHKGEENVSLKVSDIIKESFDLKEAKILAEADGYDVDNLTFRELAQFSPELDDRDKDVILNLSDDMMYNSKIVDIHDTAKENGFYACVIETSKDDAIVAFRGSEGFDTYSGLIHDWRDANFGLLNSERTEQQKETENYARQLYNNNTLSKYKDVAVTGHSLGGNLASHFGVVNYYLGDNMEPEEDFEGYFPNINQVVSFDGPGNSEEYNKKYEYAINQASQMTTHYKWSTVGSLLYGLPGEKAEYLKIDDEKTQTMSLLEKVAYKTFGRHATTSLVFDEEGNAKRGKQDLLAKNFEVISKSAEKIPASLTYAISSIANTTFDTLFYQTKDDQFGFRFLPHSNEMKEKDSNSITTGQLMDEYMNALGSTKDKMVEYSDNSNRSFTMYGEEEFPDLPDDDKYTYNFNSKDYERDVEKQRNMPSAELMF